jgi:molybdopterin synthase catalytic subunit
MPVEIRERALSVDDAIAAVKRDSAGAIVVMLGTVRDHTKHDDKDVDVRMLEYEAYAAMAEKVIASIVDEVCVDHDLRAAVQHRVGSLAIGDVAVVVAVSAAHRKEAFRACEAIIDRLKQDAPIWKREHGGDGVVWVGLGP